MRLCYSRNIIEINDWVEKVAGLGRERQKQLLEYALKLLRENFMLNMAHEELNFMSARETAFSEKFSPLFMRAISTNWQNPSMRPEIISKPMEIPGLFLWICPLK